MSGLSPVCNNMCVFNDYTEQTQFHKLYTCTVSSQHVSTCSLLSRSLVSVINSTRRQGMRFNVLLCVNSALKNNTFEWLITGMRKHV